MKYYVSTETLIVHIRILTHKHTYQKCQTQIVCFTGIQLADELGFKESLSTLEQNSKRRSVNGFPVPGSFEPLQAVPQKNNHAVSIKMYKTIHKILSQIYTILSYCFVHYTSGIILPNDCDRKIKTQI